MKINKLWIEILWVFIIFSIFVCIYETILCYIRQGIIESRQGLIYGGFSPVYGIGAVICYIVLPYCKKISVTFLVGTLLGGVVEYICSYVQEIVFGTISWNYSRYFLNFNGRTSILHMCFWGFLCVVFRHIIYSHLKKYLFYFYDKKYIVINRLICFFMILDIFISISAAYRQYERDRNIPPNNHFKEFLDQYYNDEYIDRIYPNKMIVKQKQ